MKFTAKEIANRFGTGEGWARGFLRTLAAAGLMVADGRGTQPTGIKGRKPDVFTVHANFYDRLRSLLSEG